MELRSDAFRTGDAIPVRYTCDGADISPALMFDDVPPETEVLVLICEDPDAPGGTFTHWILYNIPSGIEHLVANQPKDDTLSWGGVHGRNDFGSNGYGGPCPPEGSTHHYHFRLFALSEGLGIEPGATRASVLKKIQGKTIAVTELVGVYRRR